MKYLLLALSLLSTVASAAVPVIYPLTGQKFSRVINESNANEMYGYTSWNDPTQDPSPYAEGNQVLFPLLSGGSGIGFTQPIFVPAHCTLSITRLSDDPTPPFALSYSILGGPLQEWSVGESVVFLSGGSSLGFSSTTGGWVKLQTNHSCTN